MIGDRPVGGGSPCFIIAEAGTGHRGDLAIGKELIDAAASAGATCVKFQAVFADEIVHPAAGTIRLPGGGTEIHKVFRSLERDEGFYDGLKAYAEQRGVIFLCTAFGVASASLLARVGVVAMKIASPELNHLTLLDCVSSYNLPCIISTGVSQLSDIELGLSHLHVPVALLHCVTAYPAPAEEYNLRILSNLASIFGIPVGVSDHSLEHDLIPVLGRLSGATIVEKHLAISNAGGGLDDAIALTPNEFARMVVAIREADDEPEAALRELRSRYGSARVDRCMGDGIKRMAESENASYWTTNRTILATRHIDLGERFDSSNISLLRSETQMKPGISPIFYDELLLRITDREIRNGAGIEWGDVGSRKPASGN